jgi:nicotinamidase-related amidase
MNIFASEILRVNSVDDNPQFEVCGLTTDICVLANVVALNAFFSLSDITVLENLTFGTTRSKTLDALSVMDSMGIILRDAELKEEEDE